MPKSRRPTSADLAHTLESVPHFAAALRSAADKLERGEVGFMVLLACDHHGTNLDGGCWCSALGCSLDGLETMKALLSRMLLHFQMDEGDGHE